MKHLLSGMAIATALVSVAVLPLAANAVPTGPGVPTVGSARGVELVLARAVTPTSTQVQLAKLVIPMGRDIRWPVMGVRATARPTS